MQTIKGLGIDEIGKFKIKGYIYEDGETFDFKKTYKGQHSVTFEGKYDKE